jgi:hypothetical protein
MLVHLVDDIPEQFKRSRAWIAQNVLITLVVLDQRKDSRPTGAAGVVGVTTAAALREISGSSVNERAY